MKRGSIVDLFYVTAVVFAIAVVLLLSNTIYWEFNNEVQAQGKNTSIVFQTAEPRISAVWNIWDTIFIFMFAGCMLAVIIAAFAINAHPIFFVLSLILLAVLMVVAANFTNIYTEIGNQTQISQTGEYAANNFPNMKIVMDNLPILILFISILCFVAMYQRYKIQAQVGL